MQRRRWTPIGHPFKKNISLDHHLLLLFMFCLFTSWLPTFLSPALAPYHRSHIFHPCNRNLGVCNGYRKKDTSHISTYKFCRGKQHALNIKLLERNDTNNSTVKHLTPSNESSIFSDNLDSASLHSFSLRNWLMELF
jgi:hypothetical protein